MDSDYVDMDPPDYGQALYAKLINLMNDAMALSVVLPFRVITPEVSRG